MTESLRVRIATRADPVIMKALYQPGPIGPATQREISRILHQADVAIKVLTEFLAEDQIREAVVQALRDRGLVEEYAQEDARAVLIALGKKLLIETTL